ncbi:MAG: IPTL-CTERM sorting domain-containing protein, partial [Proteobacteria bacterium]|nr:IPTL-CTERM sorting domain-containing protein [Pseudomonadota bacterium]
YTVTVRNIGSADSEDGTVLITVPADVTVIAASLPSFCHLATATQISCDLAQAPPIPAPLMPHHVEPGDDLLIPFQLTTATPNHTGSIHATVTGVTLAEPEVIVDNNSSTYLLNNTRIIPRVEPGEVAVPALGEMALLLLAAVLGGLVLQQKRRRT